MVNPQGHTLLPLMEPSITASLDLFAPFGSSPANAKAQLKGSFGNAMLDNIPDYYSQLLTKVWYSLAFCIPFSTQRKTCSLFQRLTEYRIGCNQIVMTATLF